MLGSANWKHRALFKRSEVRSSRILGARCQSTKTGPAARFKPAMSRSTARTKKKQQLEACLRSRMLHRVINWILSATSSHSTMHGDQLRTSMQLPLPVARDSSRTTEMFGWRSKMSLLTDPLTDPAHLLHRHQLWMAIPPMMATALVLMSPFPVLLLSSSCRRLPSSPQSVHRSQHHSRLQFITLPCSHRSITTLVMEVIRTTLINTKIFVVKNRLLPIGKTGSTP